MNRVQVTLLGILVMSVSGCAAYGPKVGGSYESISKDYMPQMEKLAAEVSEDIIVQYPGKLIYVDATHAEGSFADSLRKFLASRRALAITPPMSDVTVRYAMEEFSSGMGYLNLRFNDGQVKSKTFFLVPHNTYRLVNTDESVFLPAPLPSDYYEKSQVKEQPISDTESERTSALETQKSSAVEQNLEKSTGAVAKALSEASQERDTAHYPTTHTVKKGECAYGIAKKYGVPLKDFMAVNGGRKRCELIMPGQVMLLPDGATVSLPKTQNASRPVVVATTTKPAVSASVITQPAQEKGVVPYWKLVPGSLRNQLQSWAAMAGYQLVWDTDADLDMRSSATFYGDFPQAISQLFDGLHETGHALTATLYQGNNVLEVGDD